MKYMPQEIEVWYIIPAIKREICRHMASLGLKQKQIADVLGLADSAVSQYMNAKRAKKVCFGDNILSQIKKSTDNILKKNTCAMKEIQKLLKSCKKNKILCDVHKSMENINCCCEVCLK